jgi:hypothetical protein
MMIPETAATQKGSARVEPALSEQRPPLNCDVATLDPLSICPNRNLHAEYHKMTVTCGLAADECLFGESEHPSPGTWGARSRTSSAVPAARGRRDRIDRPEGDLYLEMSSSFETASRQPDCSPLSSLMCVPSMAASTFPT